MDRATIKLGEIGKISMCKRVLKNQTKESGDIPFYKISTFGGKADCFIDRALYEDYKRRFSYPSVGDILISAAGTLGKTVIFDGKESFFQDSNIVWVANDESKVLNRYLYYFYKLEPWKTTTGSTINRLYNDNLRDITVFYPESLEEQRRIIDILKALDDKIDNNNRINDKLEKLARTIYDYWFLQFDFPDKNNRPYKSSGGKMVYSEDLKRNIPEGWTVESLTKNSISKPVKNGVKIFSGKKSYLATANINNEDITDGDLVDYENRESRANMQPDEDQIWFAKMKASIKHLTIPDGSSDFNNSHILSTGFYGISCNRNALAYLHCFINNPWFEMKKDILSHGATQQAVNDTDLNEIKIPIPEGQILNKFSEIVYPILKMKFSNAIENKKLTDLRDYLLPLLINGQVTISE